MDILFNIIFLLVGFVMLIKGADFFVEGSSAIAKKFKIPSIIVGLTIVAMGTSFPELAVSTTAALNGSNEIAISNVIGSNLFNLIIVLGVCAIISTVKVEKNVLRKDFPFMLIITGLLVILFGDFLFPFMGIEYTKEIAGTISRFDGFILVGLFIGYICFNVKSALKHFINPPLK